MKRFLIATSLLAALLTLSACAPSTLHAPCSGFGKYCGQVYINANH